MYLSKSQFKSHAFNFSAVYIVVFTPLKKLQPDCIYMVKQSSATKIGKKQKQKKRREL